MHAGQVVWFVSEEARRKVTGWYGVFAALAWALLEIFFELLFGPHVRLMRALAIGSGMGAAAGLLASALQWLVLRGHAPGAGGLIVATTTGSTLAGLISGLLLYSLNHSVELYRWNLPLQGVACAIVVGLVGAAVQWVVVRHWAVAGESARGWGASALFGAALGAACACFIAFAAIGVLGAILDRRAWPYLLLGIHLIGGLVGGAVYGRFITVGLRRLLPGTTRHALHEPPTPSRHVRPASMGAGWARGEPQTSGRARPVSYAGLRTGPHHAARGNPRLLDQARAHVPAHAR
jgi:hypothetical protein